MQKGGGIWVSVDMYQSIATYSNVLTDKCCSSVFVVILTEMHHVPAGYCTTHLLHWNGNSMVSPEGRSIVKLQIDKIRSCTHFHYSINVHG